MKQFYKIYKCELSWRKQREKNENKDDIYYNIYGIGSYWQSGGLCRSRGSVILDFYHNFGTCFYHFAVRLIVGYTIDVLFYNEKWDYTWSWFKQNSIEAKLYKILKVKSWKNRMPTYNSEEFDIKNHSLDYVIRATCQAEIVHEINVVLSFVPIVFSAWVGDLPVFVITSVLAAMYDFTFVIIQRYNRPRLIKLLERKM